MDVSKIISISRKQTSTSAWQIADAEYLDYLNIVYKEVFSRLSALSKKYTRQSYTSSLVANQSEYNYPMPSIKETGLKSVLNVYIDYWDWEKEAKIYNNNIDWIYEYDDKENPIAITRDWSLFIYPAPATTGTFRVEWKYIPLDLETTTVSASIKLASEYHDILICWLNAYIFGEKQLFDKQWIQKQMFEEWMMRMKEEWVMEKESAYNQSNNDIINTWYDFLP